MKEGYLTWEHFMGWPRGGPRQLCGGKCPYDHELDLLWRPRGTSSSQRLREECRGQLL